MSQKIQRFDFDANSAITNVSFIDVPTGGTGGAAGTISAGTTNATVGGVSFANSNGVSFGVNGQTVTATVQTNYLTTAMASNRGTDFVQATAAFAGTNASGTIASNGISVSVGNYLTTAAQSNHSHGNPTLNLTNLSGTTASNSAGFTLSLSAGNYLTTARASNDAVGLNTALTAGPLALTVNSSGISLNAGSAAGTTSGFSGNQISGSMTHNTAGLALSLNHPAWLTTARASTDAIGLNTAQSNVTWTANSSGLSIDARGYAGTGTSATNASVTLNSNGLAISVAAPGGGAGATASYYANVPDPWNNTQSLTVAQSTSHVAPFMVPYDVSADFIRFPVSIAATNTTTIGTTNGATGNVQILSTVRYVIYKQNSGANSQSMSSVVSGSVGITQQWSISANATAGSAWTLSQSITHPVGTSSNSQFTTGVTTSVTNYSLGSLSLTRFTGFQGIDVPFNNSLSAGNYWINYGISSNTALTVSAGMSGMTNMRVSVSNIARSMSSHWALMGQATVASEMPLPSMGSFSTAGGGTTSAFARSNVSSSNSHPMILFQLHRVA